jgi:ligand-binding sensor domain-containing protein
LLWSPRGCGLAEWLALAAALAGCVSGGGGGGAAARSESPYAYSRANEWVTIRDFRYVTSVAASTSLAFFGTTAGVERLDTLRDRWLAPVTAADGLPDNRVTALVAEPSTGDLWIGTARGLARLTAFVDTVEPVFGPPPFRVDRLLIDPGDGTVWAQVGGLWWQGRNGSPVLERSGDRPPFERLAGPVPVDEVDPTRLPWTDPLWVDSPLLFGARFRLTSLDRDRRGDWYVGTWGDNGRRWAESTQRWEALHFGLAGPAGGPVAASAEAYWILPSASPATRSAADVSVAPGGIRVELSAGSPAPAAVARADRNLASWSYAVPVEVEGLPAAASHAAVASGDTVWLATDYGLIRGVGEAWERWGADAGAAYALALDGQQLWVGGEEGVTAFDRRDGSIAGRLLEGRRVDAVIATAEAVYAGTPVGLFAGRRAPSPAGAIPAAMEQVEYRGGAVRALAATDTLLVVASATGLEVFDRRRGAWSPPAAGEGRVGRPLALAVDPQGNVWVGTERGISRWRPGTGEWDEWTPADGLAGVPVRHVLAEDGVVWASTPAGLSRFAWREGRR